MAKSTPSHITVIEKDDLKYLVLGAPSDSTLPAYIQEFKKHGVKHVARLCEPTYLTIPLEKEHIQVHEMAFADGQPPPADVLHKWLKLISAREPVAVHCVAGLGRAPMLVAIALIELGGMDPISAIEFVRKKRPDAFNHRQVTYLCNYKRQTDKGCCVML